MSKFITGPEALIALANGSDIQCLRDGQWQSALTCTAVGFLKNDFEFRIAPKLIKIGSVEIEAPETEPLAIGTPYYTTSLTGKAKYMTSVKWSDHEMDFRRLCRRIIHLSAENAIAHAKALILASGGVLDDVVPTEPAATEPAPTGPVPALGQIQRQIAAEPAPTGPVADPEDPLSDLDMDEPPPPPEHENPPAPEKKRRQPKKQNSVEPVADTAPAELANDTAEFVTPPAIEFDEPQPVDLAPVLSERMAILLEQVANAKTGAEIITIKMRYTHGLAPSEIAELRDAMARRNRELMALTPQESAPVVQQPERLSMAERIKASHSLRELAALVPEMDLLDHQIAGKMGQIYEQRRQELLTIRKNAEGNNHE